MDKIVVPELDQVTRLRNQKEYTKAWVALTVISTSWKNTGPDTLLSFPLPKFSQQELPLLVKFAEEVTICAYYVGNNQIGLLACNLLFCLNSSCNKQMVGNNLQFYVDCMPFISVIDLCHQFVTFPKYSRSNPSAINWDNDLLINCRLVNYTQEGATHFKSNDADGKIRTRNLIKRCRFNESGTDLEPVGPVSELVDENNAYKTGDARVLGMEDIRLFKAADDCWCLATSQCASIHTKVSIVLCYLGPSKTFNRSNKTQPITVTGIIVPEQQNCEKNWNILTDRNKIYLVYQICPSKVFLLADLDDPNNNLVKAKTNFGSIPLKLTNPIVHTHPYLAINDTRGGTNYIPYRLGDKDGFLCMGHHVVFRDKRRYYYHRWVFLTKKDGAYGIDSCSGLFYLMEQGIEFAVSLSKHPKLPLYYIGCGIEDKDAMLLSYYKDQIDSQLIFN